MRQDPVGRQGTPRRRGFNPRLLVLVLFAGYAAYYWFSNRSTDPLTGEQVVIDRNITPEDEKALGLQAFEEILQTEQPVDPNSQIARQIREVAQRLIAKVPQVTDAVAAEHGQEPSGIEQTVKRWRSTPLDRPISLASSPSWTTGCAPPPSLLPSRPNALP